MARINKDLNECVRCGSPATHWFALSPDASQGVEVSTTTCDACRTRIPAYYLPCSMEEAKIMRVVTEIQEA